MNIFALDDDPKLAAQYHYDKHVVKMILESAQMLSTAYYDLSSKPFKIKPEYKVEIESSYPRIEGFYKAAFVNHPCSVWARKNISNWKWLLELALNLCDEYTHRYKKIHKTESVLKWMLKNNPQLNTGDRTEFSRAMNEDLKNNNSISSVDAYRKLYTTDKLYLAKWTNRNSPDWFKELCNDI